MQQEGGGARDVTKCYGCRGIRHADCGEPQWLQDHHEGGPDGCRDDHQNRKEDGAVKVAIGTAVLTAVP